MKSLVAALVASSVAVTVIVLGTTTTIDRQTTYRQAGREIDQRTILVAEHTKAVIQTNVMLLDRVADHFGDQPLRNPKKNGANRYLLQSMLSSADGVDSIRLYDQNGDFVLSTTDEVGAQSNVADREYFQAISAGQHLFISPLIQGRVSGNFFFVAARRLEEESGALRGIALVAIRANRFADFYRRIAGDENASIVIRKLNGDVVIQTPLPVGEPPKGWPPGTSIRQRLAEKAAVYERASPIDGVERLFAFRRLDPEGLVVIAGRPLDAVFADWRSRTALLWGLGGSGLMLSLVLSILVLRHARRRADALRAALQAVKESEERFEMAVAATADGIWDWNLRTGKVRRSARMKAMYGFADDEMGDETDEFWNRLHPDDAGNLKAIIQTHFDLRTPQFEAECRVRHKDGDYRWLFIRGCAQFGLDDEPLRMVGMMTDVTSRRERELKIEAAHQLVEEERERAHHAANHDTLTGLPNRAYLNERLAALAGDTLSDTVWSAVMMLDLDNFKTVNDTLGHPAGDQLLQVTAGRLQGCLREGDFVARLGGDEFAVLLSSRREIEGDAVALGNRIITAVSEGMMLDGRPARVGCSVGISIWKKADFVPAEAIRQADVALYEAKRTGRNRVVLWDQASGLVPGGPVVGTPA